ncbi:MAG: alpha-E domain-containing protein [Gammaproteobacteria bacterium]|nr:alpha-E domain-containing protein [Gammaproteobacteria bacterium]
MSRTLSSTAKRSYWLGRYLERAENTARIVSVNANLLIDLPVRLPLGWQPLVDITGADDLFADIYEDPSETHVVHFLLSDLRNPGSLFNSLSSAKENARTLRGILSREVFEYVNELQLYAKQTLSEPLSRTRRIEGLSRVMERIRQIDGFLSGNMLHDANWNFLRIGNFIERADMLTRIVDVRSSDLFAEQAELEPFQDIQWRSILRSLSAMQSYNVTHQEPMSDAAVLGFLFKHQDLPRSYVRCLNQMRNSLKSLPRHEKPLRSVNRMRRNIASEDVSELHGTTLHEFIDRCQHEIAQLHDTIDKTYFDFKPRRPRRGTS